jgi:RNA polymerase-binding transcription factor DksA
MATQKTLDHFGAAFIAKQQKKLEKMHVDLLKQKKKLSKYPDIGNSVEDTAQEMTEYGEHMAIKDTLVDEKLEKVEAALKRIEKGTYGICLKTKQPIESGRLELIPEAEYAADAS